MRVRKRALSFMFFSFTLLTPWLNTSVRAATTGDTIPQDSIILFKFAHARKMFFMDYKHNRNNIQAAAAMIRRHLDAIKRGEAIITINGYCQSFATDVANLKMAKNRSNQVKSYYITHLGMKEEFYRTRNHAFPYHNDKNVVAMLRIDFLKEDKPLQPAFPHAMQPTSPQPVQPTPLSTQQIRAEKPVLPPVVATKQPTVLLQSEATPYKYPSKWTVKTNVPYWALVVFNAAVEYHFAPHWSADLPMFYLPFTVARTYRFRILAAQPSARYWLKPSHEGHFFGVHSTIGQFNISIDNKTRYQDKSGMYGGGLDYGYAFRFNDRWGVELNIGAGYIYTRYNKYYNIKNGALFGTNSKSYWGVTRFGVSVTYQLNGKGK